MTTCKAYKSHELRELAAEPLSAFHLNLVNCMRRALLFSADAIDAADKATADQEAECEALREDAARYLAFFSAGLPISFLGQVYETKAELDAAIDQPIARGKT